MSQPTMMWDELAGRAEQRKVLVSFLTRGARTGAALAVSGQPGVGKSALVEATITAAGSAGYVVLVGSGSEFEVGIGFATLNQVLLPVHDVVPALDRRDRMVLAGALGHGRAIGANREQIADATLAAVARIRPNAPVLIAVDDVQWADRASAAVLTMLARAALGRRLAVLVAYRSDEPLPMDLSAFEAVEIPPLDRRAASALLSRNSPGLASSIHDRVLNEAQGNPLALVELPTGLTDRQRRAQEELPAVLPLNRRLRSIFGRRLLQLDVQVRRLLLLAALDGRGTLPVLAAALGQDTIELASGGGLSAAMLSGLITVESDCGPAVRVVFRHPLVRATVLEVSSLEDRQRAHRALAFAHAGCSERRAWHLAEATSQPDGVVAELLEDTASASLQHGDAVGALTALVRAAELSPLVADRQRRLARAAYLGTDVVGDLARVSALLAEARDSDPASARNLDETVAAAHVLLVDEGDADTAHRLLVATLRAWSTADSADPRSLIPALSSLFEVCIYSGRPEFWPPLHVAMARLGDAVPSDLRLLVTVLADPARATPAALAELDTAVARLERDQEHDPTAIERIATAALFVDRVGTCERVVRRLADEGRSSGAITSAVNAAMVLWAEDFQRGRWESGARLIDDALALCRRHGLALFCAPLQYGRALLAAVHGDDEATERLAAEISAWGAPRGLRAVQYFGWHARALSAVGRGDFTEAHRLFGLIGPTGIVPQNVPHALWMIYDVVEAAIRSGHRSEAIAHVRALRRLGVADISARLAMVVAGVAALTAPASQAGPLFEAALATPSGGDWPFDYARVRLAYGEHLRRQRKITLARAQLSIALRDLQALSAWPWVSRAAAELRAAEATAENGDRALTPQQHEIATLAGAGLTNNQIAERLQLSPRTVAAHLRQVFAKLGIASRGALHDTMRAGHRQSAPALQT
jgi:DNA-binding CsgD family transcriptional regulator